MRIDTGAPRRGTQLTARESQVLAEYQWHGNRQEAADCIGISLDTLGAHVTSVLARTGALDAISAPLRAGWAFIPASVEFAHRDELAALRVRRAKADPLEGLSSRELEALRDRITRALEACVVCGNPGAIASTVVAKPTRFAMRLCPACIERFRLPEARAAG